MSGLRSSTVAFTKSKKEIPFIAALASGLYPLLYYYYSNFTVINSLKQFVFFIIYFVGIPVLVFKVANVLAKRVTLFNKIQRYILPILNLTWFTYLMVIITKGGGYKFIAFCVIIAVVLAILTQKHFKKLIVFQFLLAIMVILPLAKYMLFDIEHPKVWMVQPDNIENAVLKKRPNIYLIQPDGYANFSEIDKGYYKFDNSNFKNFLLANDFNLYDNYRSNYYSTLSSNSSMFGMKHHYYNFPSGRIREVYNARDVIVGDNPVVKILKNNNYKTYLLLHKSYMFINRPDLLYDYTNIDVSEMSYFTRGFQQTKDIFSDLKGITENIDQAPKFFFLEQISPGHVTNKVSPGNIADQERKEYIKKLQETNVWLKNVIQYIAEIDPEGLIVITADHGGFVGMNTTIEARGKSTDRDLIYSIFTSQLAIKWPEGVAPSYHDKIKTPVNLFRVLFSYLSDNEVYLENLQPNTSYIPIEKGAPFGIYEYINEQGEILFNKVSKNSF